STGGFDLDLFRIHVTAHTLYTPVLVLTVLGTLRASLVVQPHVRFVGGLPFGRAAWGLIGATVGCVLPLVPFFVALTARVSEDGRLHAPTMWRSSPPGVDLLALITPNPNSPLFRGWLRGWLDTQPGGFVENVASVTFVGVAVVAVAMWRYRIRPPPFWLAATAAFALLSLGPFIHVAGRNTYVPGPWALLRYLPIVASARMPARFAVPTMMGLAILFASSLAHIAQQAPARSRLVLGVAAVALVIELAPVPRAMYDASLPSIYVTI